VAVLNASERGSRATALVKDSVFQEALEATRDWALREFNTSSTQEEAWRARQLTRTVDEFAAYLLAAIQLGKSEVDELILARERLSKRKQEKESVAEYLDRARIARREYDESHKGVAEG
jgi:hypothetical protein